MIYSKLLHLAKKFRREMTEAEKTLWEALRRKDLDGYKFRRQFPLSYEDCNFIADFYCSKNKLIIEVDGGIHNIKDFKESDKLREDILIRNGYKILRFQNSEVLLRIEEVIKKIKEELKSPLSPG